MADTTELPPPAAEDELKGSEAPLLDHLIELRKRLIYSLLAVVVLFLDLLRLRQADLRFPAACPIKWAAGDSQT